MDFSSAFNTIIPQQLICNWLLDFPGIIIQQLHPEHRGPTWLHAQASALHPVETWLHTILQLQQPCEVCGWYNSSGAHHQGWWKEVDLLTMWCKNSILLLNVSKTQEIFVNFQRGYNQHLPLNIDGATVERVSSTKFLGVHISEDLSWNTSNASLAKKVQQCLYLLRKFKGASAPPPIMTIFYRGTTESILSSFISVWGGSCTDYNSSTVHCEHSWEGYWCTTPLPYTRPISFCGIMLKHCSKSSNIDTANMAMWKVMEK